MGHPKGEASAHLQFSLVQSFSRVQLPHGLEHTRLSIVSSRNLIKLISIESVMPSNHLILCSPLLLLPSVFPRPESGSFLRSQLFLASSFYSFVSFPTPPTSPPPALCKLGLARKGACLFHLRFSLRSADFSFVPFSWAFPFLCLLAIAILDSFFLF